VGFNPFASDNVATSILRVTTGPSLHVGEALPTVPLALERTIDGLVEKNRDLRLPSAKAARERLAPVVDAVRARFPDLLQRLMRDPVTTSRAIARAAAADEVAAARSCERTLPAKAMVHAARARAHDPEDLDAASILEKLSTLHGFVIDVDNDARVAAAVAELDTRPDDPVLLRRLANLHRGLNNPLEAVRFLKRYLMVRPDDAMARQQLGELLGVDDVIALTRSVQAPNTRLSTQEIMHGVRTGGVAKLPVASSSSSLPSSSTMSRPVHQPGFGGPARIANDGPSEALLSGTAKVVIGAVVVVVVLGVGSVISTAMKKGEEGLDKTLRGVESTPTSVLDGMIGGTQLPFVERAKTATAIADWQGVIDAANFGLSADPQFKGEHTPLLLLLRSRAWQMLGEPRQAIADARLASTTAPAGSPLAVEAAQKHTALVAATAPPAQQPATVKASQSPEPP